MNLPRQQSIIEEVRERGYLSIEEMAQMFAVTRRPSAATSTSSPNRDCCAATTAVRPTIRASRTPPTPCAPTRCATKQRIAEAVASLVPDNASLFINIGTTTEAIARALLNHRNLKIITNNLHVAATLSAKEDFEVLVAGGTVRSDGGIVGQAAVDFIQQFRVDFALVGISGIDEDGSLLDFDYQEVRVSQAIIDNARQVFLAADSSKFGRNAVVRLGPISLVNRVISDSPPPAAIARLMAQHKVHLDLV